MKFELDLLQNAMDSLREALSKFSEGSVSNISAYKFSVLHFSHFLELLFKYHVSESHPLLIYKNPFSKKIEKENTIGLWDAIQFLRNEGKEFSSDFSKDLEWLKKLRNDIEHHKFEMNVLDVRRTLGRLIRATDEFNDYYGVFDISERLIGPHLSIYKELLDEYTSKIKDARISAKSKSENKTTYDCTHCGESDTAALISGHYICQLCEEKESIVQCCRCGDNFRDSETILWNEDYDEYMCDYCYSHISSM